MEIGEEREGEEVRGVGEERESRQRSFRTGPAGVTVAAEPGSHSRASLGAMTANMVRVVSDWARKGDSASTDGPGRRRRSRRTEL